MKHWIIIIIIIIQPKAYDSYKNGENGEFVCAHQLLHYTNASQLHYNTSIFSHSNDTSMYSRVYVCLVARKKVAKNKNTNRIGRISNFTDIYFVYKLVCYRKINLRLANIYINFILSNAYNRSMTKMGWNRVLCRLSAYWVELENVYFHLKKPHVLDNRNLENKRL